MEMTPDQEAHLQQVKDRFALLVDLKYRKGQAEHGGDLSASPTGVLLTSAIEEVIDLFVYLSTLQDALAAIHRNPYSGIPTFLNRELVLHHQLKHVPNPLRLRLMPGDIMSQSYFGDQPEFFESLCSILYNTLEDWKEMKYATATELDLNSRD